MDKECGDWQTEGVKTEHSGAGQSCKPLCMWSHLGGGGSPGTLCHGDGHLNRSGCDPPPPPQLSSETWGGGLAGVEAGGIPTYGYQNYQHVALIILTTHK